LDHDTYDALGRQIVRSTQNTVDLSTSQSTWTYDQTGPLFGYGVGRMTTAAAPNASTQFAYDAHGQITAVTQSISQGLARSTAYTYDSAGRLASVTYPSGRIVTYSYIDGQLSAISVAANSSSTPQVILSEIQMSPFGPARRWDWQMAAGAQTHERQFDTGGRIVRYPLGAYMRDVSYDPAGRIGSYSHYGKATGAAEPALNQSFSYDSLGRLTNVALSWTGSSFSYDANGNRTSASIGATVRDYSVSATSNRLNSVSNPARAFTHDAAGNTITDASSSNYTSTYNHEGRLASITAPTLAVDFVYDAMGQRVRRGVWAQPNRPDLPRIYTLYSYDLQGHLIGEYQADGTTVAEYVWFGDTPVAVLKPAVLDPSVNPPQVFFIHADHLDAPRVAVDSQNRVRWRWMAEPFGVTPAETTPTAGLDPLNITLRLPGQQFEPFGGLHYNYFRDYDPTTGRYVQSDPIGLGGGINTYAYVGGNPLSFTDRFGLKQKASSAHCVALRKKMQNFQSDLDDRWADLAADRLALPDRIGPGELLSTTKRGHRTLINERESRLRKFEKRYSEECEDDDDPGQGQSCDTGCAVATTAATMGAGYIAYRCLRMIPSLLPPLWPTIPANIAVP